MLMRVDYENPTVCGALTLFPVFRDEPPARDYVAGPEGASRNLFDVSERGDGAVVPELVITNRGDLPCF